MSAWFAGIDVGSWNTKAVVIDAEGSVLASAVLRSGVDLSDSASRAYKAALASAGGSSRDVAAAWSTGFGRRSVPFATGHRTELDCHARGVSRYVSGPLTLVDIGGQDAKVIRLDERGRRLSQRMNRKCAAGTGSFLEEVALRLGVTIGELDRLARDSREQIRLSSFCTVFAGTELLSRIRAGARTGDLARAAYRSLVQRVLEMDVLEGTIVLTGGVAAHHRTLVELIEEAVGTKVVVPPRAQEIGALGAALAAREAGAMAGLEADPQPGSRPERRA